MLLDENQIQQNWDNLILFIENNFDGEREEKLLKLYNDNAERIATAPASNRINYHSCFVGGYVYHVLNVIKCATKVSNLWLSLGGKETYTQEELMFTALNHDLGKMGDLNYDYYIPISEDWKVKRGILYDFHHDLQYMSVQDRSLFLLQQYGITMTQKEFISIKIHDGLYDEGNKSYYITYEPKFTLKTMLPHILHWGDMMAMKLEYEEWLNSVEGKRFLETGNNSGISTPTNYKSKSTNKKYKTLSDKLDTETTKDTIQTFDDLFGKD